MRDLALAFRFGNRELAARAEPRENEWVVRVFEGDRPVTRVSYTVTYEIAVDMAVTGYTDDAVSGLLELARADVLSKNVALLPPS